MHKRRLHTAAVVAAAIALSAARADAGPARRVGVVVTTSVNIADADADELAAELGRALEAALPVDTIAGAETRRRLPPAGLPDECVADATCRNDLGRRLDADELLLLVIARVGGRTQIDATWADVASGQITSRPAIVLEPDADRAEVLTAAAPDLLPHIDPTPEDQRPDIVVVQSPGAARDAGPDRHMTTGAWIATGVSGAALVGGAVFALSARTKFQSLEDDDCRNTPCPESSVDALGRHALAADVLLGVGIASGVTAFVLYLRSDRTPADEPAVTVGPGPGDVGVTFGGRF